MQDQQQMPVMPVNKAPKDSNKSLVVILIVLIVAIIIAAIVAVIVIINVNKEVRGNEVSQTKDAVEAEDDKEPKSEPEPTEKPEEEKKTDPNVLIIRRRDAQREDDLARMITASNMYQANNNGKLPFSDGEINKNFIKRYIDSKVETTDGLNVTKCGDEFKDPNGKCYSFAKPVMLKSNKKDALKGVTAVNNKFYVFIQAICGDNGEVEYRNGTRIFAIMYKLEMDKETIACNDNY